VASSSSFLAAVNKPKIRNPLGFGENTQVLYHCLALYISEQLLFVPSLIIGVDKTRVVHTSLSVCEVLNMVCPTVVRLTAFLICIILPFFFFSSYFSRELLRNFTLPQCGKLCLRAHKREGPVGASHGIVKSKWLEPIRAIVWVSLCQSLPIPIAVLNWALSSLTDSFSTHTYTG
jgi:hypothetical protein